VAQGGWFYDQKGKNMSSVIISGDTSGAVTVAAPAVAGTNTLTLQAATATSAVNTLATAVASTSGTSINFTSIPSWVKRITVMFSGVSTSGTSDLLVQLGTGATPTYTTSGYLGSASIQSGTVENFNTGYEVVINNAAASVWHGNIVIANVTSNTWSEFGVLGNSNAAGTRMSGGSIPLAAVLTAVRITTVNGTDTFDAGTINILYEG
jgi:hypothetical protein